MDAVLERWWEDRKGDFLTSLGKQVNADKSELVIRDVDDLLQDGITICDTLRLVHL